MASQYIRFLHEHEISLVAHAMTNDTLFVLPKPGNISFDDEYLAACLLPQGTRNCDFINVMDYLCNGHHPDPCMRFAGWKDQLRSVDRDSKPVAGILSMDVARDAQHYVCFIYNPETSTVYLFDSACRIPSKENECYGILKHAISRCLDRDVIVKGIAFPVTLQPGGGYSAGGNIKDIYCHTWCLWFLTTFSEMFASEQSVEMAITNVTKQFRDKRYKSREERFMVVRFFAIRVLDYLHMPMRTRAQCKKLMAKVF